MRPSYGSGVIFLVWILIERLYIPALAVRPSVKLGYAWAVRCRRIVTKQRSNLLESMGRKMDEQDQEFVYDKYYGKYKVNISKKYCIEVAMNVGPYEPEHQRVMRSAIREGDVAFDIGANAGALTIVLADLVGPHGRVHSFEPGPHIFKRLHANINLNQELIDRVVLNNCGVGPQKGDFVWYEFSHMLGNAGFHKPDGSWSAAVSEAVPVIVLDDYVKENGIENLSFIKIDTENFEYPILLGARATLEHKRPIMTVETLPQLHELEASENFRRIQVLLHDHSYTTLQWVGGQLMPATPQSFSLDTIAVPSEKIDAFSNAMNSSKT